VAVARAADAGVAEPAGGSLMERVSSPRSADATTRYPRAVERVGVVIVGGGPMGVAAARALGSRGREVLLFERSALGHDGGSSAGPTRNFRLTYHDPIYVRMARLALEGFRRLEDEAGVELLRTVGGLDVGVPTDVSAAALEAAGEPYERPSDDEVADRFPTLRFPPGSRFLYQSDGGILRSKEVIRALADRAVAAGAAIREETTVASIRLAGAGVEVRTDRDEVVRAPAAILAAGAWTGPLARSVGLELPLRPTLEQSTYLDLDSGGLPTVIDWSASADEPPYLVPNPFDGGDAKAGAHLSGRDVDPDTRSFDPDVAIEARVLGWVRDRVVGPVELRRTETCLYTRTPDEDFVIDRIGPVVVASPCSGHGFKFTPVIGEVLADLVTGSEPAVPLDRFAVRRPALVP
jgi:sarcosine oxidase